MSVTISPVGLNDVRLRRLRDSYRRARTEMTLYQSTHHELLAIKSLKFFEKNIPKLSHDKVIHKIQ